MRLAEYSRDCLKALRDETGIRYCQAIVIDGWIHTSGQVPLTVLGLALRCLMSHLASAKDRTNPADHPPLASDLLVS